MFRKLFSVYTKQQIFNKRMTISLKSIITNSMSDKQTLTFTGYNSNSEQSFALNNPKITHIYIHKKTHKERSLNS